MNTPHPGITVESQTSCGETTHIIRATGADALLDAGKNYVGANPNSKRMLTIGRRDMADNAEWYGMDEAGIMSLRTWPEGLALVDKCRLTELPEPTSLMRKRVWAETGDEFDRDRFDSGQDECWSARKRALRPATRVVKLTCQIGGLGHRSADELVWAGAIAAAVTDQAENAGYRVEVEAISSTTDAFNGSDRCITIIPLKAADDTLNLDKLVMAMACPAFFRWYMLRARTLVDAKLSAGYGATASVPYEYRGQLHISGPCYSESAAKYETGRLLRQLERLNQPEEEPDTYVPPPPKRATVEQTAYVPVYTPPSPPSKPSRPVKVPVEREAY